MTEKILFVDDDVQLLEGLQRSLRRQFNVETAVGGSEGLNKIAAAGPFALIVADMQMPGMSGLEFLRQVQVQAPESVRIMLTGNADQKTAMDALNDGRVFQFLTKPCPATTLAPALVAGLDHFRLVRAERELLENTLGGALKVLTEILSMIDPSTFERGQQLRETCREFAEAVGFQVTWETEIAAMLLSIGRVTIPPSVLEKLRQHLPLNAAESQLVRQVPELGARLLEKIPRLENVVEIVRYQARHFDGSGFPEHGPVGSEIPLSARLLKFLGDLLDLEAQGIERSVAWKQLQATPGQYDPEMVLAASRWCRATAAEAPAELPIEEVDVEVLLPGWSLARDLFTLDGLFLLAAGTKVSELLLAKLQNFRRLGAIGRTIFVHIHT